MKKRWQILSILFSILTLVTVIVSLTLVFSKSKRRNEVLERSYTTIE